MNFQQALERVKEGCCPGVPSKLACRPKCWSEQKDKDIYPIMAYLALLPYNGPLQWFVVGLGNEPIEASFDPEAWLILTRDDMEWDVFPRPTHSEVECGCTERFRCQRHGGVQTVGGTYPNYVR
jgi:hypothetical protein